MYISKENRSSSSQGEKYALKKRLAEGGFSQIDLAENTRTKRLVALKRITCHSIQVEFLDTFL